MHYSIYPSNISSRSRIQVGFVKRRMHRCFASAESFGTGETHFQHLSQVEYRNMFPAKGPNITCVECSILPQLIHSFSWCGPCYTHTRKTSVQHIATRSPARAINGVKGKRKKRWIPKSFAKFSWFGNLSGALGICKGLGSWLFS